MCAFLGSVEPRTIRPYALLRIQVKRYIPQTILSGDPQKIFQLGLHHLVSERCHTRGTDILNLIYIACSLACFQCWPALVF